MASLVAPENLHQGRTRLLLVVQGVGVGGEEVAQPEDGHERVVEVVGDAGGHLAQRLHPLALNELALGGAELLDGVAQLGVGGFKFGFLGLAAEDFSLPVACSEP